MGIRDSVRSWIVNLLDLQDPSDVATRDRIIRLAELRSYYDGLHKEQLRVKYGKYNDNITVNLVGLIVDKGVSALVGDPADGQGLSWTFPSETGTDKNGEPVAVKPPQIKWLDEQWKANGWEIFIHKNALIGAESGIPCIKIVPDGAGNLQLRNVNPLLLTIDVDPQDAEKQTAYHIAYTVHEGKQDVSYREDTLPANPDGSSWTVETKKRVGGGRWEDANPPVMWNYPFPPILDWQNLPASDTPYGRSDIEGIIAIQDRYNFAMSNLSKIIRLYAHPQRYGINLTAQMENGDIKMGPDEMPMFNTGNQTGGINQLAPAGDLAAAMQYTNGLRELMFLLAREPDVMTMKDKTGVLTNFTMKVLYRDFLDKLGTKRMLYGRAYQELNRRMLVLHGVEPETCTIKWPDPLPVNQEEETTALQADMNMGIVDKQTAAEARGYDWKVVSERMNKEQQNTQNVGGTLLTNFFAGVNKNGK